MTRLKADFYCKNALEMAPLLIGKLLCRKIGKETIKLRITETESYYGIEDTASHAHKGKTQRNEPMFEKGGTTYIYLCYGVHNLLNIVSGEKDNPEAVLLKKNMNQISTKCSKKKLRSNRPRWTLNSFCIRWCRR